MTSFQGNWPIQELPNVVPWQSFSVSVKTWYALALFYVSLNVFSTKVLIGDTIFTSPNGDGTAILRGHPSHAKVSPLAVQRKYLHFSVILRPWVMVRARESNSRPPALQSNALPTELTLPRYHVYSLTFTCFDAISLPPSLVRCYYLLMI